MSNEKPLRNQWLFTCRGLFFDIEDCYNENIKVKELFVMQLQFYSHRNADAIIRYDQYLYKRYEEFLGALLTISDDE